MKKILTMMAASLMTFGLLYAETETPTLVESYTDFYDDGNANWGQEYSIYGGGDNSGAYLWYTAGTEGWVITNETGNIQDNDYHLSLETAKGKPLFRTVADLGEPAEGATGPDDTRTMNAIDTGTEGIVVDTKIQFTGFEEDPVPTAEDKILVWMKAVDAEENENGVLTGGETNLYITAMILAEDGANSEVGPLSFEVPLDEEAKVGKEYQITIKSIGNILSSGTRLGFLVYVDGKIVKIATNEASNPFVEACTDLSIDENLNGYVFPSLVNGDLTLKAAGFEGTGTIDDLGIAAGNNGDITPEFALNYTVSFNANLPAGATLPEGFTLPNAVKVISGFPIANPGPAVDAYSVTVNDKTYKFKGWATAADSTTAYNFAALIYDNLILYAIWTEGTEIPKIAPGGTAEFTTDADAASAVLAINADKEKYITAPTGFAGDLSKYRDMFEAVVLVGTTTVAIQLTEAAEKALKAEADSETTAEAIISAVLSANGTLSITGTPGLYYSVLSRGDLSTGAFVEGERKMADSEGNVPDITLPKHTGKGFYKLNINIKP